MKKEHEESLKVSNSRKVYLPFYVMIVILLGAVVYIYFLEKPIDSLALRFVLLFCIFVVLATEIHRLGNSYEINNHSVIHRSGYFSLSSKRLEFGAISDSDVRQTFWQRLWGYGDVEIHLFSRENTTLICDINHPHSFVDFLQKKMKSFRGGRGR